MLHGVHIKKGRSLNSSNKHKLKSLTSSTFIKILNVSRCPQGIDPIKKPNIDSSTNTSAENSIQGEVMM